MTLFSPDVVSNEMYLPVSDDVPVTVTMHEALNPPSWVVAVMVADPGEMPLTVPLLDTVATLELLVDQVTALFVASEGEMVAMSVSEFP